MPLTKSIPFRTSFAMNKFIIVFFVHVISYGFVAQDCFTKADFAKLQKLTSKDAKAYLDRYFSTTYESDYPNSAPECAEEMMDNVFEINKMGYDGACYYDFFNENAMIMYQIKNKAPIYIYWCDFTCYDDLIWECRKVYKKRKDGMTENYGYTTFLLGTLTLEFRTYFTDELSYVVLLYNKTQVDKSIVEAKKKYQANYLKEIEDAKALSVLQGKCDSILEIGKSLLEESKYTEAKIEFQKAFTVLPSEQIAKLVQKCDEMLCWVHIDEGDLLLAQKKYREAVHAYLNARDCGTDSYTVEDKISKVEKQELSDSVMKLEAIANGFFIARDYYSARATYNQILAIDSWRYDSKKRISEIDALLQFLAERKYKVYDYVTLESASCTNNLSVLQKSLSQFIESTGDGDMLLKVNFRFDTLGNNLSTYALEGMHNKKYYEPFNTVTSSFQLNPSSKNGYYVNAETKKSYHVMWQTDKAKYRYTHNGVKHRRGFRSDYTAVTSFIRKNCSYGTYTIESKSIELNQDAYRTIRVTNYKANAGPLNVFYSLLLPGLGTKRVTYGLQGTGRMLTFLISGGLAYGSYYLSGYLHDKSVNAPTGEGQKYLDQSNYAKYTAYGLVGISASIYVYDFFHVLTRGFKNTAKNKKVNQQIMDFVPIKADPIKLK